MIQVKPRPSFPKSNKKGSDPWKTLDGYAEGIAHNFSTIAETMLKLNDLVVQCVDQMHQESVVLRQENKLSGGHNGTGNKMGRRRSNPKICAG